MIDLIEQGTLRKDVRVRRLPPSLTYLPEPRGRPAERCNERTVACLASLFKSSPGGTGEGFANGTVNRDSRNERMSLRRQISELQWRQHQHDVAYHHEIVILSVKNRVTHMTLHFAKYTAHLFSSIATGDDDLFERILIDSFVISLATANALKQDLGKAVEDHYGRPNSLNRLGKKVLKEMYDGDEEPFWIARRLAKYTGQLAKACESMDHIEDYPFRTQMEEASFLLFRVILAESSRLEFDLIKGYFTRLHELEQTGLFHRQLSLLLEGGK